MTIDDAIKRYNDNAEYERTHGSLQGCLEFRQLAEWLKDYKRLKEQEPKTEKVIKMRDATPEEQEAIAKYIKSISKPTGVEFDEEQEQLDFVQPHKKIPVTLTVSGDLISREAVLDTISELNAISFYEAQEDSKECYYSIRQAIKDLSPVKPQEKTGHWVKGKCDQCGGHAPFWSMATTYYESEYCPNCGCRMVEPQESEDKE